MKVWNISVPFLRNGTMIMPLVNLLLEFGYNLGFMPTLYFMECLAFMGFTYVNYLVVFRLYVIIP